MGRIALLAVTIGVLVPLAGAATCPPAPRAACRLAPKGTLRIIDGASETADRFLWKWSGGTPTVVTDFGDPTTSTALALCLYDATGLVAELGATAGGTCEGTPCWQRLGTTGFAYRDRAAASAGLDRVRLKASRKGEGVVILKGRGAALPDPTLPLAPPLTVQLVRDDAEVCFEALVGAAGLKRNDAGRVQVQATFGSATPVAALPSAACGQPTPAYPADVSTPDTLAHDGETRTFRVYVPPGYDAGGNTPVPVVLVLHGGFGSGEQVEASTQVAATAAAEGFVAVSPDGVPGNTGIRTWNGGTCCGYAATNAVDDTGFIAALLDHLESRLCIDRRRVYAMGISNGAIMSYRLACELSTRIRAIGPVAGPIMHSPCAPARPVPVLHVHGTADGNVPFEGGLGCGVAGVPFTSVPETLAGAAARNGCKGRSRVVLEQGDGTCMREGTCPAGGEVWLCTVQDGGHVWPGGEPPVIPGLPGCPFGHQSQTFDATTVLWDFFATQPPR